MARELSIFVNTTDNQLITSLSNGTPIKPTSLPLNYGDTVEMKVFLLRRLDNPISITSFQFEQISTAGLALQMYLDDNRVGGTQYTSQVVWNADPGNEYFYASLPLNTAQLLALIGTGPTATCYLRIVWTVAGIPRTIFLQQIQIGVGAPNVALVVPGGLTPLAAETAAQTYVPLSGKAGQAFQLVSPNGKILIVRAVDNPDGTASFEASPAN